jgi:hypothetical protein
MELGDEVILGVTEVVAAGVMPLLQCGGQSAPASDPSGEALGDPRGRISGFT